MIHPERQDASDQRGHARLNEPNGWCHDLLNAPELPMGGRDVVVAKIEVVNPDLLVKLACGVRRMPEEAVERPLQCRMR